MRLVYAFLFIVLFLEGALASQHQYLNSLGSSQKGQFIALEEYGYNSESHTYYSNIRIINVWTSEDVGKATQVEISASNPQYLVKARLRAKELAKDQMLFLKITQRLE